MVTEGTGDGIEENSGSFFLTPLKQMLIYYTPHTLGPELGDCHTSNPHKVRSRVDIRVLKMQATTYSDNKCN